MKKQKSRWFVLVSYLNESSIKKIFTESDFISDFCYTEHIDEVNAEGHLCCPHVHAIIRTKYFVPLSKVQSFFDNFYVNGQRTLVYYAYCLSGEYSYLCAKPFKVYTSCVNFGDLCRRCD